MSALLPFHLQRKVVPKVWGGSRLTEHLAFRSDEARIGETWELFDRPEGSSALRDGSGGLAELVARAPQELLGERPARRAQGRFPLLIKFIDSREALSVQVHPDDQQAGVDGDLGKAEAWLVLEAGPESRIIRGWKEGGPPADLRERLVAGEDILADLDAFVPRVGDVVDVPPGTVHSIGPGVVLFEVQRNSDLTYRLYDWGRDRELHLESALQAVSRAPLPPPVSHFDLPDNGRQQLVLTDDYELNRLRTSEPVVIATDASFKVINVLGGTGTLAWHSGGEDLPLRIERGDCLVVPACVDRVFLSAATTLDLLITGPGEIDR